MAIGKSFLRPIIRPGILGAVVAFLVLVAWAPALAQKGESRLAAKGATAQASTPSQVAGGVDQGRLAPAAAADAAFIRFKEVAAGPDLTSKVLPTDGKTIPTHVYAPYYTGTGSGDVTPAASGARYFTMAFLQTAANGPACTVYWNGSTSSLVDNTGTYFKGITNLRSYGADVIPSFGGSAADTYNGTLFPELADRCTDIPSIAAEYERVITTLNVTRIDLDTEEDSLRNPAGIDRRNKAIKMVQDWAASVGRTVEWVYTLPTNVQGLDAGVDGSNYTEGAAVLRNAVQNGTRIDRVDIMTFDYYDAQSYSGPPHNMGADTITAATHLYDTLRELYPGLSSAQLWGMIGFCEDVGRDDFGANETYYLTDATTDMAWAVPNGLGLVTFWNYSRDTANRGGTPSPIWSFSKIFDAFTGWGNSTGLLSSANPSTSGQAVTFTASISAADPGLPTPTGTVQFQVDGSNWGSPVALDGGGEATSDPISTLSTGTHAITATYSGDAVFSITSATLTQAVDVSIPVLTATSIGLTSSQNPVAFGPQVTFTATVTPAGGMAERRLASVVGGGTPTGTVQFLLDDVDLNGPVALVNGQASSSPVNDNPHPWPASGPHNVTAIYSGDANFQPSVSQTLVQTVDNCGGCATDVTVASTPNPSYPGQTVSFTWNVGSDVGSPTGSVQIMADGATLLGTWPSISYYAGTVQVQSSTLTLGSHSITASYSGDADFAANTSAPLTQVVNPPVSVTVTMSPIGRSVSVDGGRAITKATAYTWAQGGSHTLAIINTTQAGAAGTQYVWSNWSDGGAATHIVTAPSSATTYTANFNTQYQLTTAVSPSGAGTVSPLTGGYDNAGTPVPLSATPASGYVFQNWSTTASGTLTNPTNPTTATVSLSGPATVTATFGELKTSLSGLITGVSGTQGARAWTITLSNTGPGAASAAQINSLTLKQTGGAACSPAISSAFPVSAGNIAPASSGSGVVTINFTGCPNNARFTTTFTFSANAGTVTGSRTLNNQFQ
ncbi:MAG TPA: Ig-like domain repeat protein [Terriglobia bacterium]|nr:Ig-like domain repeat protein [Terriglobia bacterium]